MQIFACRYQIDKILQGSSSADLYKDDPLRFKPDLDNFDADESGEEEHESDAEVRKFFCVDIEPCFKLISCNDRNITYNTV